MERSVSHLTQFVFGRGSRLALAAARFLTLILLACACLCAQEFRATVTGSVTDVSGAPVPNVRVEVKNLDTAAVVATATNGEGNYVAPFVSPGRYDVTATAQGFKQAVRHNLELRINDRVQVDLQLQLGAVSESIEVSASAELLDTTSASAGQVIDKQQVANLPMLGRNPFMLATTSVGVQWVNAQPSKSNRPFDNGGMDNISINGGRALTNEYLLDGVPNTNSETTNPSNLSFVPSPDATSEFKVQTNTYDAQFGRTGGGTINVLTKSGTNKFHGSVFEFWRNDKLNANTYTNNANGAPRSSVRWNQPGVEIDGPLVLPKIYNGRDRTFFMYSWEDIRSTTPSPQTFTVPTDLQRTGDFSRTMQSNGKQVVMYDPLTTVKSGSSYVRTAFPGNLVPTSRWDPVATKLLAYIPRANSAGTAVGANNLVATSNSRRDKYDAHIARFDHNIGDAHRIFTRIVRNNRHEYQDYALWPEPSSPFFNDWRVNGGANLDITDTLSPTTVLNTRIGYNRHEFVIAQFAENFDLTSVGFPSTLVNQMPARFFPSFSMADYSAWGPQRSYGNELAYSDTWSVSETLNKVVHNHSLKVGAEFRTMRNNQQIPTSSFGQFGFTRGFTQADPLKANAGSGNGFASFLLGSANSGSLPVNAALALQNRYFVVFLQDDWRITRRLTVNLGLRWDYETPQTERYDQQNRGFDAAAANPFQAPGMSLKGGLLFTDANNRLPFKQDRNNFQPRVGVAYQLTKTTVFRGGFGISYLPTFNTGQSNGFSTSKVFVSSTDGNLTPADTLANPYPTGIDRPVGRSQGLATMVGRSFTFSTYDRNIPYVQQFSAGFQQQLPWRVLVDASYVGSRTKELQVSKGINEVSAASLALGVALNDQVSNPFAGLLPGTAFNGATVVRSQLLRSFPQFAGITQANYSGGYSSYDSFQLRVEKRFAQGFSLLLSYTRSKMLEATDYLNPQDSFDHPQRVISKEDAPNRFVLSGVYQMPFFQHSTGITRAVLGGWALNGIATWQSGLAVNAPSGAVSTGVSPALSGGTMGHYFNTCTITLTGARQNCVGSEAAAFRVQGPYELRSLSTRLADVRTKRPLMADLSIFKNFRIVEGLRLQVRGEAFNAFNTAWFSAPNLTLNSSSFGVVTPSQANDPRNIQVAMKLIF